MGIDLVPGADTFAIRTQNFRKIESGGDGSIEDGCIDEGTHRVLRFNLSTYNVGDKDLVIGDPKNRPDIFEYHPNVHPQSDWIFREKFYVMTISNNSGIERSGSKRPFCLTDNTRFNRCDDQGISPNGQRDMYDRKTACNFIEIGDFPDGLCTLKVTTNYTSVIAVEKGNGKVLFEEDDYKNNTIVVPLEIIGNRVIDKRAPTNR
jgi:hypothetical protein